MGDKKRTQPSTYELLGLPPLLKDFSSPFTVKSGVFDSLTKQYGRSIGSSVVAKSGVFDSVLQFYGRSIVPPVLGSRSLVSVGVLDSMKSGSVFGGSFSGKHRSGVLGLNAAQGGSKFDYLAAVTSGAGAEIYGGVWKAGAFDQFRGSFVSPLSGLTDSLRWPGWPDGFTVPLAPGLPRRAEELADLLLPANLQGFTGSEWSRLIDITTEDGIGLMWAPGTEHLRGLLSKDDREGRYAYLLQHQDDLLDELNDGLQEVVEAPLQDLVRLGMRAIECARASLWEGALALATNVLYSAMEEHGIAWYRQEFNGVRDHNNQPIHGSTGPGSTVQFVISNIPMPERRVGIFDLAAHLVTRPMSHVFKKSQLVQGRHNRHAVCHEASYASLRKEYVLPAMLNMHALLRVLDEKMADNDPDA
ncbi:hypothetical protein ACIREE_38780 [Streptomyces sp. NPDC102467]|uniref:hypothetical protein n=1 Tax=Streptomyces sp. NPDC102467 TaxID=3366179 RepID=UPI003806114B